MERNQMEQSKFIKLFIQIYRNFLPPSETLLLSTIFPSLNLIQPPILNPYSHILDLITFHILIRVAILKYSNERIQQICVRIYQQFHMHNQEELENYQEINFTPTQHPPQDILFNFQVEHTPLSQKQQRQLLYGIKIGNENLLDLVVEEPNPRNNINYRDVVQDRIVEIIGPFIIQDGRITSYKLYKIKTKKRDAEDFDTVVERRFSDFEYLHTQLVENYGGYLIPRLPQKSIWTSLDMETPEYIKYRKERLKKYIERILSHNKLKYTEHFLSFLFDFQNNFSQKKGEYFAQKKPQNTVIKLASNAIQTSYNIFNYYLNQSSFFDRQPSLKIPKPIIMTTKQDQQIARLQIIVNGMTAVIRRIKMIVSNTYEEAVCFGKFNEICEMFLDQDVEKELLKKNKSYTYRESKKQLKEYYSNRDSRELTRQTEISSGSTNLKYSKYEQLLESYQNLFEFIETCKEAINRRTALSSELQTLKYQYTILQPKQKENPRNINLDVLRSKVVQVGKKYDQFTQELLEELQTQIDMSKSMVNQFVKELELIRNELYTENSLTNKQI